MLMLLAISIPSAWAADASFAPSNFSGQGTSGTGSAISATVDGVTFACNKGYGTTQIRCYSGGKVTISSSNTITAISFTFSGSYTGGLETSYTNLSTTSWEKSLSGQARITACTVTYSTGGGQGGGGDQSDNLFEFDGGISDIASTDGISQSGLGSDYTSSPKLKFDGTGDYVVVQVSSAPGTVSYDIKGNGFSGGTFKVQQSTDGSTYSDLATYTTLGNTQSEEKELNSSTRYIKFIYTTKSSGNVALGNIVVTKGGSSEPTACETPTYLPAAGAVLSGTAVALTTETEGADIYYTMGLSPDGPTKSSTKYTAPISITEATTIKAIAVKDGLNNSEVATASYTILEPKTIAQIMPTSETEGDAFLLNDVTVTYAYGSNVYVKDATGYMMVYSSITGAANGKVLQGLQGKAKLYKGLPEISTVTQAPTVTDGSAVEPEDLDAYPTDGDLNKYVTLEGVTFASAATLSGSVTNVNGTFKGSTLIIRNTFKLDGVSLATGKSYRIVGVVQKYNSDYQVYPITIDEETEEGAPEAPTFSPAAGTYTEVQSVTLSCETQGATIYYTTDGTTPTSSSAVYSSAISVGETMTIKAIAIKNEIESALATAAYTINLPEDENTSKTWDLSIASYDNDASADKVTWSATYVSMVVEKDKSSTAANNYLGGDANNRTSSRMYKDSKLTITPTGKQITTITFAAVSSTYATALANSTWTNATAVASGSNVVVTVASTGAVSATIGGTCGFTTVRVVYTVVDTSIPAEPTFSLTAGTYTEAQSVTLACETQGATIYYTTNGSTPTNASTQYTTAISVGETMTIKAVAIKDDKSSPVATAKYTINLPEDENTSKTWDLSVVSCDENPTDELMQWTATYVTMSIAKGSGTKVTNYYPGTSGHSYTSTRFYNGNTLSFVPNGKQITTITFTATSSDYATALANSTWTNAAAEANSTTVVVTATGIGEVSAAIGATCGFTAIRVAYTDIDASIPATPTFSVAAGTYTSAQSVELSCETQGATIYYTIDSSDPDNTKAQYSGAISVEESMTIKAIAIKDGKSSAVATAAYTINIPVLPDDCDGADDFITATSSNPASYAEQRTTSNGWNAVNVALTTIEEEACWLTINGKTTAVGMITSPTLNNGISSLTFNYANTFKEDNGVSIKIEIKQGEIVAKEYTITKANENVAQNTVYTETIENINVEGNFQLVIANLSPSQNNSSNKDRVSIGKLCWTNYSAPVVPEPDYTRSITAGQFGTICLPNSGRIEDATIFEIAHTKEGKIFFDEISEATMDAGRPYIFYPNNGASELKVYYTGSENAAAGSYKGLYGSYEQSLLTKNAGNYILYDNKYYLVDSEAYVGAYRAYIKLGEVPTEEQAPAPGRRRVSMDVQGEQVATSIINTHYGDQPMKVMIDNQLYIIRAGQMFDMTGNKIK